MTRSLYVIGGAGSGKSTFMAALIAELGWSLGPYRTVHSIVNPKNRKDIAMKGHDLDGGPGPGVYLGQMREHHPGTDGLDRVCPPTAEHWLANGDLPPYIIAEGATLATQGVLSSLYASTTLLLVHLWVEPFVAEARFAARGTEQRPSFVANTVTRSRNLALRFADESPRPLSVDTGDGDAELAVDLCAAWLRN